MQKYHKARLLKLAQHLKTGKLGHKKFDFSVLNDDPKKDDEMETYKCGTNGCALGECPIVFPRDWSFIDTSNGLSIEVLPLLRSDTAQDTFEDSTQFFGIDIEEAEHLFAPYSQDTKRYGGKMLRDDATRKQVANQILAFLKNKEQGK